ncbi:hypothetical protein N656DRAFT_841078 [Canariomyces notabilis]|uniref:DUF6594 domain-containing protein n=1 Tax=Canariomyces notabilis TaxID=2074819 RepID=A0AAN6TNT9_9PEZI|nr:hypothetical protein N656DRAFT_841078 [Canariomyces arenarius]
MDDIDASVAEFIARAEDWAIFRRFRALNVKNIMTLQKVLLSIENGKLQASEERLDEILDKYNRALCNYARLCSMEDPQKKHLTALWHYINDRSIRSPGFFPADWDFLPRPDEEKVKRDEKTQELVAICPAGDGGFVYAAVDKLVSEFTPGREDTGTGGTISTWTRGVTQKTTRAINTAASAILLVAPIIILHFVKDGIKSLILIVVWTVGFSVAMSLITEAKNSEIMMASAA